MPTGHVCMQRRLGVHGDAAALRADDRLRVIVAYWPLLHVLMVAPLSERRVFWLVGDRAGCHAVRCLRRAENMRENRAASTFMQVTAVSPGVCKTVGLAYVGSNPTPATTCGNGPWPGVFRACGLLFPAR